MAMVAPENTYRFQAGGQTRTKPTPHPTHHDDGWPGRSRQALARVSWPYRDRRAQDWPALSRKTRRRSRMSHGSHDCADHSISPAEDNLNISLKDITVTGRDGRVSQLDQVYIRGSMVRFFIVPDMLQNAPMWVAMWRFVALRLRLNQQVQTGWSKRDARTWYWHSAWTCHHYAGFVDSIRVAR